MKKVVVILLIILFLSLGISYATDVIIGPSISVAQCPTGVASHEIVYNTNGGSEEEADYVSSMKPIDTSLPTPTKDGYIFAGWYYDSELTKKVDVDSYFDIPFTREYDENGCTKLVTTTLYAKWDEIVYEESFEDYQCPTGISPYKIVYNSNGGNIIDSFSHCGGCLYKENPVIPTPSREGYKFAGWYYDSKFKNKVNTKYATGITYTKVYDTHGCQAQATVNLYAKWTKIKNEDISCSNDINNLKVIFNTDGGTNIEPVLYCSNCDISTTKIPTTLKEGYTFDGWYYDTELTKKVSGTDFSEIIFTQKYDNNNCLLLTEVNLYAKWNKNIEPDTENEKTDKDEKKKITIIYDTDGGEKISNESICNNCGNKTELKSPTKEGFNFVGWYYDKEYTKKVNVKYLEDLEEGYVLSVNQELVLYAKWETIKENKLSNYIVIIILVAIIVVLLGIVAIVNWYKKRKKKNEYSDIEVLGL